MKAMTDPVVPGHAAGRRAGSLEDVGSRPGNSHLHVDHIVVAPLLHVTLLPWLKDEPCLGGSDGDFDLAGGNRQPARPGRTRGYQSQDQRLSLTAALIGSLLLVPAVLGAMRLTGGRAAWLSLTGGSLMIAGYVCYLGVAALSAPVLAMAGADGPAGLFAQVIDDTQGDASTMWMFVLFVVGNLIGTFLLGLALLRSHAVAAWAAIAVMAWPVLHITGLAAGTEWFEVAGLALQAAGLAAAGVAVLRRQGGWATAPQAGLAAEPG